MRISDWSSDVCSSDLPAEDDHKDAPNRSHRSTYTAFDPSHACGLLTGHPGPSMPAKPLTDHFPPADSRSGTAKPPAAAGSGGGAEAVLEAVAQQVLLHLAHGVARQLVHEEHLLRHLEVGERGLEIGRAHV